MNASSWHSYLICPVGSRAIARAACAVQLVVEPTVNPGLSCSVVVPWLDSLAQHVRVVATEAHNLLFEPAIRAIHQLAITGIPDVVAARECSRDAIARRLDGMVAERFGVVGVNGIDFVARDGVPYAIEINPRWCASMELVEQAYGLSVFAAHASACATGTLPAFDLAHARRDAVVAGKAVVFARRDVTIGDTRAWLDPRAQVRDVPRPGQRIQAGHPVCTVFATARDGEACHAALVQSAERIYAQLAE